MAYGTLQILDTLAKSNASSVLAFGEEELAGYLNLIIAGHNAMINDIEGDLVGIVPAPETTWGVGTDTIEMVELDEFGVADAQKVPFARQTVGFPLRRRGASLQWTRDYLAIASPVELANQVVRITEADLRFRYAQLRRVLFNATNNTGYVDRLVDERTFTLRALVNADGQAIAPNTLEQKTFNGGTHTHYLASASLAEADYVALEETVREHGLNGGDLRIYINPAQEAAVRAFAGFQPYVDSRIVYATDVNRAAQAVDRVNVTDRAIGFHGPAEVWVKTWMPANYHLAFVAGGGGDPVVGERRPTGANAQFGDLRIVADLDRFPLHARAWERQNGFSIWNRTRAAVLFSGGGSYTNFAA